MAPRHVEAIPLATAQPRGLVVEVGDTTYVLGSAAVEVYRNGTLLARGECTTPCAFTAATAIAAPTGDGRWAVAVDGHRVVHVTQSAELEDVGARFGLAGAPLALAAAGHTFAAIEERSGGRERLIAVSADGVHLARVPASGARDVAAARGRIAVAYADRVESWDLATMQTTSYPVANAHVGFVDAERDSARLVAWTDAAVDLEGADRALRPVALPAPPARVAIAGARLWIAAGAHVLYVEPAGATAATAIATDAPAPASLTGSPTGAAWAGDAKALVRLSPDHVTDDPTWQTQVQPVFARVCAHCHLPGGEAGIDLSTPATWHAERDELRRRVLVTATMPPAGTTLSDPDRHAIESWLDAAAK
jgi:mono/diheme cytochrome c family protein|nr:cytochrome c [Kofleriaceae bacterium]